MTVDIGSVQPSSVLMTEEERLDHLEYVFDLLSKQDDSTYIGEQISQLAHSLQAAHLASLSGQSESVAIAALLHDIGQVLPLTEKNQIRGQSAGNIVDENGQSVGRIGHELIGEHYLRLNGWPEEVCALVGAHVMAKRYLAMDQDYYNSLSKASKSSLKGQGGPFTEQEANKLRLNDQMLTQKIALRRFDDGAKVVGRQTRSLQQWWEIAKRVYIGKGESNVTLLPVEVNDQQITLAAI